MEKISRKNIKHIDMIPVYQPYFTKKTLKYAHDAIDSTWVSSHGKYLDLATEKLKEITGSKYVLLTNNGTSATHLVACALRYKYPHISDLIVPSNVYVAAWNMFKTTPDFKLWPADSDINTWNMDLTKIPNPDTAYYQGFTGILSIPNLGNPVDYRWIKEVYPKVPIVEDNCEGFLSNDTGKGFAYSVSFFGNKTITSGEGGAFFTDDEDIYNEMNRIRCQGFTDKKFIFNGIGYNYRMTNIAAAILFGQLEIKNEIVDKKKKIFDTYKENLQHPLIHFQCGINHSNWMFGIRVEKNRDLIVEKLANAGIETRPMFPPINMHSHYSEFGDNFPVSKQLYEQVIILPSYPELKKDEILKICDMIKTFLDENN